MTANLTVLAIFGLGFPVAFILIPLLVENILEKVLDK